MGGTMLGVTIAEWPVESWILLIAALGTQIGTFAAGYYAYRQAMEKLRSQDKRAEENTADIKQTSIAAAHGAANRVNDKLDNGIRTVLEDNNKQISDVRQQIRTVIDPQKKGTGD